MTVPDDLIRAEGQYLARYTWHPETHGPGLPCGDWLPDPDGTHEGWLYKLGFYTLPRTPDAA